MSLLLFRLIPLKSQVIRAVNSPTSDEIEGRGGSKKEGKKGRDRKKKKEKRGEIGRVVHTRRRKELISSRCRSLIRTRNSVYDDGGLGSGEATGDRVPRGGGKGKGEGERRRAGGG